MSAGRSRAVRTALAFVLGLGLLAGATHAARAQDIAPEGSNFHNGSSLPLEDEGDGRELMRRLQAALDRAEPDDAAAVLRALRADRRVLLLPFGPRTHMAALDLAARLVAASGDGPVLQRVLEESRAAIAQARGGRDLERLLDHATRGSALPSAREAALAAARLEFESGAFWEAATLARRAAGQAGAAELEAAARRHLAADSASATGDTSAASAASAPEWQWQGALRLPQEIRGYVSRTGEVVSIPTAADAGEGRLAILDADGLSLVSRHDGRVLNERGAWLERQLDRLHAGLGAPAPLRFSLLHAGEQLLLPFNTLDERGVDLWSFELDGHLLALDLAGNAEMEWAATPAPGSWSSTACGPAVVAGPRVCTLLFRSGLETEVSLAGYALSDGRPLFEVPLVAGTAVPRYGSRQARVDVTAIDKRSREGPPAERDGLIYACTGYGVVAVVDALTGWLRHTFRYDRIFSEEVGQYDPSFLYATGGWDEEPVRLWGDRVVVAPGDSRFLYVLADEPGPGGQLMLDDPIERLGRRYVAGLLPDPAGGASPAVLLTGRMGGDWGLELLAPGGKTLARTPPLRPDAFFSGRPIVLGSSVLVPSVLGLLRFRADDLSATPSVLAAMPEAPTVVSAVVPLENGFITFSPQATRPTQRGERPEIAWIAQWYRASP